MMMRGERAVACILAGGDRGRHAKQIKARTLRQVMIIQLLLLFSYVHIRTFFVEMYLYMFTIIIIIITHRTTHTHTYIYA